MAFIYSPSPLLPHIRPVVPVSVDRLLPEAEVPESTPLARPPPEPRRCGIILQRDDYYTVPSVEELDAQSKPGKDLVVQDFTVGRKMYGKVRFLGPTSVSGLNLDELGKQGAVYICRGKGVIGGNMYEQATLVLHFTVP